MMQSPATFPRPARLAVAALSIALACVGNDAAPPDSAATADPASFPPPPAPESVSSAMADSVPLESLVLWDARGAQLALASDGLASEVLRHDVAYARFRNGLALGVGAAEVHLFFFGDIAAADAAYRGLDVRQVRPVRLRGEVNPRALINNNMLVILLGGDPALRERILRSLTPGSEDRRAEEIEP